MLTDNHGRKLDYLRLAVTDRCNLRCFYCMPAEGLSWLSRTELLSSDEMVRMCRVMAGMGITKVRITGGEPFVRKDIIALMSDIAAINGINELTITTNGVLTAPYVSELKQMGVKWVNLSLDTLNAERFYKITLRDEFAAVMQTMDGLLAANIGVKINAVVMAGKNTEDIIPLCELTRHLPINVRFIEEMPFNGDSHLLMPEWDHVKILAHIKSNYSKLHKLIDSPGATANTYKIDGFAGNIGIIAAYTRTFCGSCNRIRVTPTGTLKTCLYDGGVLNIRDLMRSGCDNNELINKLLIAFNNRPIDGHEAEKLVSNNAALHQSMAYIGG